MLDLLKSSDADLKEWVASQDTAGLRVAFESIDAEIRGARLAGGQPRNVTSAASVELARIALRVAEMAGDEFLVVEGWRMLAYSLSADEQRKEALPYYALAIPGLERVGKAALAARTRIGYVAALSEEGRYDRALEVAGVAERWFQDNGDDFGLARLCTNVAALYMRLDDYLRAYRYHTLAFETFARLGDEQSLAQSCLNLGNVLYCIDQFEKSDEMYEKSEKLSLKLGMTELSAQASYNRAYLHYLRGRYSDALQAFSRLRSHFEQSGSRRHYALCDMDEAEIYDQLNLSRDAAALARRAIQTFRDIGLKYEEARAQVYLGIALIQLGRPTDALEVFKVSRKEFEDQGNQYFVGVLDLYRAEVHLSLKRLWEARSLAEEAKDRFDRIKAYSKKILSLVLLGRVSMALKDIESAEGCVKEIVEITERIQLPLVLFPVYILQGDIAEKRGQWKNAERFYEMAADDLELHQARIPHDDLRVTFFSVRNRAYEELVRLKLRNPDPEDATNQGYAWCERAKSRGLIELLAHHLPAVQAQGENSLLTKINRLREELNMLYARSQPEQRPMPSQPNFEAIASKENELARSLREISRVDPEYVSLQQVSTATLKSVQEMLPADTTMVEYFITRDEVMAFVVTRGHASVERRLCPSARVADVHQRLGFQLEKFLLGPQYHEAHADQIFAATQRHLQELYELLLSRLTSRLNTPHLTIVPHGILHLLPFHAFFDGNRYLIDRFDVSYAPSASVLKYCLEKKDLIHRAPALIGVADESAPFVEQEIRTIAQMFPNATVLLNSEATREAFVRTVGEASFLHIATHAIFRQDNPMFSGFKLSDGWITALDLFSLSCQTNLVTLSGCKSGMSQVTGNDDLVGLMRGFLYAGARSLLVSLWNVDDETTSLLMARFYDLWSGDVSRSAALAAAMKAIRETHPNPFYWAPFLLVGKG